MARFGLVAPPLRGHLDPMMALGEELGRRGHAVSVFLDADVTPSPSTPPASRLELVCIDAAGDDGGMAARLAQGAGPLASILAMTRRFERLAGVLPDAMRAASLDAVICDQTEPAAALASMKLGLPYASVAAALPLNTDEALPPPYVPWRHADTPAHRWLYRGGRRAVRWMMSPLSRAIAARACSWGLPPVPDLEASFSPRLQLTQLVPELDWPRSAPPDALVHVGPLRRVETASFASPQNGKPVAFCTLGTLQGHRARLLGLFAEAAARAGCRPVVAHAGAFKPADLAALPADAVAAPFLPQRDVLEHAAIAICHGGMNTVMDALAAGAPVIVVPLGYEQGAIGARVEAAGAGIMLKAGQAGTRLVPALHRVLEEPSFRQAALRLANASRRAGGTRRAATLVEEALTRSGAQRVEPLTARSSM